MDVKEPDRDKSYRLYRHNIEHEDNLLNHRLSWLLIAQSFLFGACVTAGRVSGTIRFVGVASCLATYVSIIAAIYSIRRLKNAYLQEASPDAPPIVGLRPLHGMGLVAPLVVPVVFLVGWLLL